MESAFNNLPSIPAWRGVGKPAESQLSSKSYSCNFIANGTAALSLKRLPSRPRNICRKRPFGPVLSPYLIK